MSARRFRPSFRTVKDLVALPAHGAIKGLSLLPDPLQRVVMKTGCALPKAYYWAPGSHVRRCTENLCAVTGRRDPYWVYSTLIDNLGLVLRLSGKLLSKGPDALTPHMRFDPESLRQLRQAFDEAGGAILLVPHCTGSVLSSVLMSREFPTVIMARESKSEHRRRIMRKYFDRLGPETIEVRRTPPAAVARRILKALHEHKLVIGTTDLIRRKDDTVPIRVFGREAWAPGWPARFAQRRKVPIIPGFIYTDNGQFVLAGGEPYQVADLEEGTQRWMNHFAEAIGRWPQDWPFMFEKRWARLLEEAAAAARRVASA